MHHHKIKEILYKAKYRGSKEVDYILTTFVGQQLDDVNLPDYDNLITFLNQDDLEIFACVNKDQPTYMEAAFTKYLIDIQWFRSKVPS